MAIKGKSKPRARKGVTRGPKPAYVSVRKPLLARRGFQIGLLAVLLVVSGVGIWFGFRLQDQREEERALRNREREALTRYQTAVESALQGLGQATGAGTFDLFPQLPAILDGFKKGDVTEKDAADQAEAVADAAGAAWEAIEGVDVVGLVRDKGFPIVLVNYFLNSKEKMVAGLQLYEQVGTALQQAAASSGDARQDLLEVAEGILPTAKQVFDSGFSDLTNAQFAADPAFGR